MPFRQPETDIAGKQTLATHEPKLIDDLLHSLDALRLDDARGNIGLASSKGSPMHPGGANKAMVEFGACMLNGYGTLTHLSCSFFLFLFANAQN